MRCMSTNVQLAPPHQPRAAITVLLAEGHERMRSSLRKVLDADEGIELVAEATNLTSARRTIQEHRPQILLLDLRMGSPSPFDMIEDLRRQAPGTAVVVISMETGRAFAEHALSSGAIAYVVKDSAEADLPTAVRCAAAGERYVSPQVPGRALTLGRTAEPELSTARSHSMGPTGGGGAHPRSTLR